MFYFNKRTQARDFAKKADHYKVKDMGTGVNGKRWAVKVLKD